MTEFEKEIALIEKQALKQARSVWNMRKKCATAEYAREV